jgi:selenocysteine-specific elongation factor
LTEGSFDEQLESLLDDPWQPLWQESELRARTGAEPEELRPLLEGLAIEGRVRRCEWGSRLHWMLANRWHEAGERLCERLRQVHEATPELPGHPVALLRTELFSRPGWQAHAQPLLDALLGELIAQGKVKLENRSAALVGHEPRLSEGLRRRMEALVVWLEGQGYGAPRLEEIAQGLSVAVPEVKRLLALALQAGHVEQATDQIFLTRTRHLAALEELRALGREQAEGFTVSQAGTRLGASRRFMVPYLEALDERGVTRRNGNFRSMAPAGSEE